MRRAQQKSYAKAGVNWHGSNLHKNATLAVPIVVFESSDMPEDPLQTTLEQDRAFEAALRAEAVRRQKEDEANPKYQKPQPTERIPDYVDWSRTQKLMDVLKEELGTEVEIAAIKQKGQNMSQETITRWKKREQQLTNPNPPSASQIRADERKHAFDRHSEKRNATAIDDERASASPAQRLTESGQQKVEGRNRFGDPLQAPVDPREKPLRETVWGESSRVQRNGTGMAMDQETQRLRDDMRNDPKVADKAAGRAPSAVKPQVSKPQPTAEDIQAFVLFLAAAHPEWPIDERRGPNDGSAADQRYREAIVINATNLHRIWRTLRQRGHCEFDLQGLLLSWDVAKEGHFLDDGKPRTRGFGNQDLVNIAEEPKTNPQDPADAAVREVLGLVRSGQARFERMRPANEQETAQIQELRKKDFRTLAADVRAGYRKG